LRLPISRGERLTDRRTVWLAAAAVVAIGVAGVWLVFDNYCLSLDEFMANFDARIFLSGHLMARVPEPWPRYLPAMDPNFVLKTEGARFVASAYLPMNAALRAGGAALGLQFLVNPILAAIAMLMTYAVGRQLWPRHPRRAVAAALLLATSSQFLVASMSAYAMTAHLAFNMVWLWLFLKDRRWADGLAIAVGAVACGLHQVVFHPFFVGPFILELLLARRWLRAGTFIAAYGLIGLFWISWWTIAFRVTGATPASQAAAGASYFVNQVSHFLAAAQPENLALMALNLTRFVSWQNVIAVPLMFVGGWAALRRGGPLRAMTVGLLLVPTLLTLVLPTQVHGWGYRYLHGFLGAGALLAVAGWSELVARLDERQRAMAGRGFVAAGVFSLAVLFPLHGFEARAFSHPLATSYRAIAERPEDYVFIDNLTVGYDPGSMVRNDPALANRPKVFLLYALDPAALDDLCKTGHGWIFDGNNPAMKGVLTYPIEDSYRQSMAATRAHLKQIGCVAG
jgi:hypothetical protein